MLSDPDPGPDLDPDAGPSQGPGPDPDPGLGFQKQSNQNTDVQTSLSRRRVGTLRDYFSKIFFPYFCKTTIRTIESQMTGMTTHIELA